MDLLVIVILILILGITTGLAYLGLRFFRRFTQNSRFANLWNALIFIAILLLGLFISFVIIIMNIHIQR